MTGVFDPTAFLDLQVTESNDTKLIPIPPGEYVGQVEKVDVRPWQSKDGLKSGLSLDVTWNIDDQRVKEATKRDKNTVRQGCMLDTTDTTPPGLDMGRGKNVALGRLREAVGLNANGAAFAFRMLEGRAAKLQVSHRPDERPGAQPGDVFADVKGVAKLG